MQRSVRYILAGETSQEMNIQNWKKDLWIFHSNSTCSRSMLLIKLSQKQHDSDRKDHPHIYRLHNIGFLEFRRGSGINVCVLLGARKNQIKISFSSHPDSRWAWLSLKEASNMDWRRNKLFSSSHGRSHNVIGCLFQNILMQTQNYRFLQTYFSGQERFQLKLCGIGYKKCIVF